MNLVDLISAECDRISISFDANQRLLEVSPGCHLFYGIRLTEEFRKSGVTRQERFYAVVDGDHVNIRPAS